jgi:hypothetical protein
VKEATMSDDFADQRSTGDEEGGRGAGGGGATGHGGAGALTGKASSGFDSGDTLLTHREWDERGAHLADQSDQEREILDAANDADR